MSRHPVDRQPARRGQEHYWSIIRELARDGKPITATSVHDRCSGSRDAVADYVRRLVKGGYLRPAYLLGKTQAFELIRDSRDTPRLTQDGQPVVMGASREQLWRTMKMLATWDYRELALAASTEEVPVAAIDAQNYVKHLFRAGYLALVTKATSTKLARYRLLPSKNTGPKPPQVQRVKQVYDPNLRQVVWASGGAS
ncbi:hypothetical protein [Desulfocurvibacter africanus]|uniref:Uncharacterized protein n=1 Tax=Desulfocurvibacter africanus subsp. africanus str. Walvis Bay TaxID=690850 RepID=F3YVY8_DESAF|nr:hypothetical protein [Desulfocurvibacter africanus]EGJ49018.1 phage-related conserved putative protein [Desulfocurvibacter africanus subsp. africanus str. Walvis Bay]